MKWTPIEEKKPDIYKACIFKHKNGQDKMVGYLMSRSRVVLLDEIDIIQESSHKAIPFKGEEFKADWKYLKDVE